MRLIVNADDFGLSKGVSLGILDCAEKGIVTSTTAMVNGLYFDEAIEEAKRRGFKNIGIHLVLTWGKPVLPVDKIPTLVNEKGLFYKRENHDGINYDEVRAELEAQIEKFLATGVKPTHLDGHHHFFAFDKGVYDIVLDLAKEHDLPLRVMDNMKEYYASKGVKATDVLTTKFYNETATEEVLVDLLGRYKNCDTLEIMCHPAYVDEDLINATSYNLCRKQEFDILTSENMKYFVNKENIELIGFNEL